MGKCLWLILTVACAVAFASAVLACSPPPAVAEEPILTVVDLDYAIGTGGDAVAIVHWESGKKSLYNLNNATIMTSKGPGLTQVCYPTSSNYIRDNWCVTLPIEFEDLVKYIRY